MSVHALQERRHLYVTQAEHEALVKIYDVSERVEPLSPEALAARDAEIRALLGPLPDGHYVLVVDWARTQPFDRISRCVLTEPIE